MYLLDTHTLLWAMLEPESLSAPHQKLFLDPRKKKIISTISVWEISLKYALGKLSLGGHTPEEFLKAAQEFGLVVVAPKTNVLASFCRLKPIAGHKDPFDRMLIWQAICSDLMLLTYDKKIPKYTLQGLQLA
jgi:PIN domain nuclease of toxin-antitoxin system